MTKQRFQSAPSVPSRSGRPPYPDAAAGFTILEVLIAFVVLAIGLLGLAGLQVTGMKNSHTAYLHTQAAQLAYDMADRIRSNPDNDRDGLPDGNYDMSNADNPDDNCVANGSCVDCAQNACSPSQLVGHDITQWRAQLARPDRLPGGVGLVCIDSTPTPTDTFANPNCDGNGNQYAIKIWWDNDRDGTLDEPYLSSFRP